VKALKFCLKFLVTVAVGGGALAGSLALLGPAAEPLAHSTTPIGDLEVTINAPAARSLVFDRNGSLMATLATEDRSPVKLKDIPQVLIDAVLSIEDRKFYEHHGVDWAGTTRALFKNVDAGGIAQGGSTITQQLVKNTFSVNRKRDLTTKAREAVLAIELEKQLSKSQILEDYLNLVYFGNGAYGVQAAVERYFPSTPLAKLDLAQSALLAGLIQSPEALNPIKHPGAAARRRSEVLDAMVTNGKAKPAAARLSKSVPLPTTVSYPHSATLDYYMDKVKNTLLLDDPTQSGDPAEVLGATQQARANAVFRGGLKIYTSYDPTLQFEASVAVNTILPKSPFTASLVVIDNADGGVRAIANGRTFAEMQFDPATEGPGRQPGSSFKVFTLATALSRGYSPKDTVSTSPLNWRLNQGSGSGAFLKLGGRGDDCGGDTINLTTAISRSDNCAFVRTELSLGPGNFGTDGVNAVIQTARSMGINTSNFQPVVSTTLGTNGVHPLEMAQAYSVFPNDGVLKHATFITKIVDRYGKTIYQAPSAGLQVIDKNVARTEITMLKHVLKDGTARKSLGTFPRPAAGKTGTTDHNQDAWFVGFTPQYTAAVWMGNPSGEIPMTNVGGVTVFGATYPAQIWRKFMLDATGPLPPLDFAPPDPTPFIRSRYISELGRRVTYRSPSQNFTSTTAPTSATTIAPTPTPTTGPPMSTPKKKKDTPPPTVSPTVPPNRP
jgi:membrane peptidoglycan carboxypeptidase